MADVLDLRGARLRGEPWMVISSRRALETTWALVRKRFSPMMNPEPMPPMKRPEFHGVV